MATSSEAMKLMQDVAEVKDQIGRLCAAAGTMTGAGRDPAAFPFPSPAAQVTGFRSGFPPRLNFAGCPVKCDVCAFPAVESDMYFSTWAQVDQELWDEKTNLDVVIDGAFPLNAGDPSITLQQEADRNLTYVPSCVQISTEWSGGDPQPGMLTYQWAVAPKFSSTGQVLFSNTYNGKLYEPNPQQTVVIPFPRYKGCDGQSIGMLSVLQLIISISNAATSVLEAISVTAFHQKDGGPQKQCMLGGGEYYKGGMSCGSGSCG